MSRLTTCLSILAILLSTTLVRGADVEGTVVITKKLTKRAVTASNSVYNTLGTPVALGSDKDFDPLAYERSHVIIYIEGNGPAAASKSPAATLEQKDRRFIPDLVVVAAGSTVSFPNLDPIFHNVFSLSSPKSFDLGNYPMNQTRTVTFPKPGVVFVNCHLHPNMSATIIVTPNRWNAKADASGKFTLPAVPAGKYTLVAWHKTAGTLRKEIQVTDKGLAGIQIFIPLSEDQIQQAPKEGGSR